VRTCDGNSAYGKRSGGFADVRRRPQRPSFLGSAFAAYRQCLLFFVGVAVRVAVQASALQQRLLRSPEGAISMPVNSFPHERMHAARKGLVHVWSMQAVFHRSAVCRIRSRLHSRVEVFRTILHNQSAPTSEYMLYFHSSSQPKQTRSL
jgi:hypothetical protein